MTQRKFITDAPVCLNVNDAAMWVTGWNECLDSQALQPQAAAEPDGVVMGFTEDGCTLVEFACEGPHPTPQEGSCVYLSPPATQAALMTDPMRFTGETPDGPVSQSGTKIIGVRVQDDTVIIRVKGGKRWGNRWARELYHKILTDREPGENPNAFNKWS